MSVMENEVSASPEIFFQDGPRTPVGRLAMAGMLCKGRVPGVQMKTMRVLGSYALVYLLRGAGFYCDANGVRKIVSAGDALLISPELGHRYGPGAWQQWDEIFFVFDGPVFDLWRAQNLWDDAQPLRRLEPVEKWLPLLVAIANSSGATQSKQLERLCEFLNILSQILAEGRNEFASEAAWLSRARQMLESDLEQPQVVRHVARETGLSYEAFRKRFHRETGVSPALYRNQKRIAAARSLLEHTNFTNRAIAASLGFSDEFHFSKRFKQLTGVSPRAYRSRNIGGKSEPPN